MDPRMLGVGAAEECGDVRGDGAGEGLGGGAGAFAIWHGGL